MRKRTAEANDIAKQPPANDRRTSGAMLLRVTMFHPYSLAHPVSASIILDGSKLYPFRLGIFFSVGEGTFLGEASHSPAMVRSVWDGSALAGRSNQKPLPSTLLVSGSIRSRIGK